MQQKPPRSGASLISQHDQENRTPSADVPIRQSSSLHAPAAGKTSRGGSSSSRPNQGLRSLR
jgi:hypothetical protein